MVGTAPKCGDTYGGRNSQVAAKIKYIRMGLDEKMRSLRGVTANQMLGVIRLEAHCCHLAFYRWEEPAGNIRAA